MMKGKIMVWRALLKDSVKLFVATLLRKHYRCISETRAVATT